MENKEKNTDVLFLFDLGLLIFSLAVFVIDFGFRLAGSGQEFLLVFACLLGVLPVLFSALRALANHHLTIDLLASIALVFSLITQEWHSALFISLMLVSARLFARYTEAQAKNAIRSLLKLRPNAVHLKIDGRVIEVPIENVKTNDLVLVNAGERVAVDGLVVDGRGTIDQSSLTGESLPVAKKIGDQIWSSTLNTEGSIVVRATKVGKDTTFAKILELVEKSQGAKAPIASITDKFVNWYIFLILAGSAIIYFFSRDLKLVLSLLLVTCADDIAVAIPLAFSAAIGAAASFGTIIKGGKFLEGLSKTKIMVVDKTGTITEGKQKVEGLQVFNGFQETEFLSILAGAMQESNHPNAKAAVDFAKSKNIQLAGIQDVYEESGYGMKGKIDNDALCVGKPDYLEQNGVEISVKEARALEEEKEKGRSLVVLGKGKKLVGFLSLSDAIRHNAKYVIKELKDRGIERIIMLTGDNEKVAKTVANEVGIPEFRANLFPKDKVEFLKTLLNLKTKVLMLGDGVNDAPALVLADIGCAMGAIGSDAAIESADIILMKDNLENLPRLFDLSSYTMKVIHQDLLIWGVTNLFGLVLVFAGVFGPIQAAAFNFLTDFFPLINSLKLFRLHRRGKLNI